MSLQVLADFIARRHDDGRAAMQAVSAERDAEWKRRHGDPTRCTAAHVESFVQERIRCRLIYH